MAGILQIYILIYKIYIKENERFDKDFAVADKRQREKEFDQKERNMEKHRIEALDRE